MNEPKKRGRPSKAEMEAKLMDHLPERVEFAPIAQPPELPRYVQTVKMEDLTAEAMGGITAADFDRPLSSEFARRQAQAYARRVWDGQSETLSRHERLGRVAAAVEAQGLSMEGVVL